MALLFLSFRESGNEEGEPDVPAGGADRSHVEEREVLPFAFLHWRL
jgi:hypothetical protein